jgi:hypothetical protein
MPDIVTSKTFVDGEKGITATKLNQIISGAVIQPSFVSSKPASSTLDPTDQLLELKGAGTYATITGQQLIDSVSAGIPQSITPTIWSVRLRSFTAPGNPTFEVNQVGFAGAVSGTRTLVDRWIGAKNAGSALAVTASQQTASGAELVVPGTNFAISRNFLRVTLTTAQASLAATDYLYVGQNIEGPRFRELQFDVHSCSILVRSSVSGLKFGLTIQDPTGTRSLAKLCTIPSANTWTLLTFPNLPIWPSAGSFSSAPGVLGYAILIGLAIGSTLTAPANDTWQNGNFIGALGQDNFASKATNSTFDIAFVQHEPGAVCSTPIDCPFGQNLDGDFGCLRYYEKSYPYGIVPGAVNSAGCINFWATAGQNPFIPIRFKKVMAKSPTITGYSTATGAVNTVRDTVGADRAISGPASVGDTGFDGFITTTQNAAIWNAQFHYTADTGW